MQPERTLKPRRPDRAASERPRPVTKPDPRAVADALAEVRLRIAQGAPEKALAACQRALRQPPEAAPAEVWDALARLLVRLEDRAGALACARAAASLSPLYAPALVLLAQLHRDAARWEEAEAAYEAAVAAAPEDEEARYGLGAIRLALGRFAEGWTDYVTFRRAVVPAPEPPGPRWDGRPLPGETLLLFSDGGLGDAIMYARYIPQCAERARVAFAGPAALQRLFATLPGLAAFVPAPPLPPYAATCGLSGLPLLFRTTPATIPAPVAYLHADPVAATRWAERLARLQRPRIGLVWAGNPEFPGDADRSVPLARLERLLALPGPSFVSLQKGTAAAQAVAVPKLVDWMGECNDLADTAALIDGLDLVIAVDTAMAHLAGALGKPVWLLNRLACDWRWAIGGERSPWYPTLRQFRQERRGDWSGPVAQAAAALRALA
jgi:tetratricopeptide (TPR) repeat protein